MDIWLQSVSIVLDLMLYGTPVDDGESDVEPFMLPDAKVYFSADLLKLLSITGLFYNLFCFYLYRNHMCPLQLFNQRKM
jgi:hypothetical protein